MDNRDVSNGWKHEYIKPSEAGEAFITNDEWQRGTKCWDKALVGYVMGFKLGFIEITNYAKSRWKTAVRINQLCPGVFLFDFESEHSKKEVLEGKWIIRGKLLVLKPWTPDLDPDKLDLSRVPVWVQLPKLHLSLWNPVALCKLVSVIGTPLATDKLTAAKGRMAYARVLVEVPIQDKVPLHVPVRLEDGRLIEQEIYFEWVPVKCSRCNRLGHVPVNCSKPPQTIWVTNQAMHVPTKPVIQPVVSKDTNQLSISEVCKEAGTLSNDVVIKEKVAPKKVRIVQDNESSKANPVIVRKEVASQSINSSAIQSAGGEGMIVIAEGRDVMQVAGGGKHSNLT